MQGTHYRGPAMKFNFIYRQTSLAIVPPVQVLNSFLLWSHLLALFRRCVKITTVMACVHLDTNMLHDSRTVIVSHWFGTLV